VTIQMKGTFAHSRASSAAEDLRSDFQEKIGEMATELAWLEEENKNLTADDLGPLLNDRITECRRKTQVMNSLRGSLQFVPKANGCGLKRERRGQS
jgi:hypothetical protein